MDVIERHVLELYESPCMSLASARLDKFNKVKDNDLRSLPPSMDALYQHTLRACYQAGYLWRQSVKELVIPDPKDWGWEQDPTSFDDQTITSNNHKIYENVFLQNWQMQKLQLCNSKITMPVNVWLQ